MEILETTGRTSPRPTYNWDLWLVFDGRPRILDRGADFIDQPRTFKRYLITEAAKRGLDIVAKVAKGDRIVYQVFSPSQQVPVLPDLPDARRKYPWAKWLDGATHEIVKGRDFDATPETFKAHAYKTADHLGYKIRLEWPLADVCVLQAYKPEEPDTLQEGIRRMTVKQEKR